MSYDQPCRPAMQQSGRQALLLQHLGPGQNWLLKATPHGGNQQKGRAGAHVSAGAHVRHNRKPVQHKCLAG